MTPSQFLMAVKDEFLKSVKRYPQPNHILAKLAEETGEVTRAFVRIKEDRGGLTHADAYLAALLGQIEPKKKPAKSDPKSLEWLIMLFRQSSNYRTLTAATRKARDNIFSKVIDSAGSAPCAQITRKTIIEGRSDASRHQQPPTTSSRPCAEFLGRR